MIWKLSKDPSSWIFRKEEKRLKIILQQSAKWGWLKARGGLGWDKGGRWQFMEKIIVLGKYFMGGDLYMSAASVDITVSQRIIRRALGGAGLSAALGS